MRRLGFSFEEASLKWPLDLLIATATHPQNGIHPVEGNEKNERLHFNHENVKPITALPPHSNGLSFDIVLNVLTNGFHNAS